MSAPTLVDRLRALKRWQEKTGYPEDAELVADAIERIEAADRALYEAHHAPGYDGWKRRYRVLARKQDDDRADLA